MFIEPFINYAYWNVTSVDEERAVHEVFPTAKTFVTPNIIDLSAFAKSQEEKKKSFYNRYTTTKCENKNLIISMGRLHKVKEFDILIEAISKVLKETKDKGKSEDIVLLIAGEDFGESKHLENLIDKLGLKERVFLVGMIEGEDKKEFLRNADVFALASHHENFGIVYAEALASGIPVIASRNTPWEDVEKYKCGKWVHNTPEDFANALTEILKGDSKEMGNIGRHYIEV